MDALGNYAGPVKITYALDECADFSARLGIESAASERGDISETAPASAGACR
jgi:hypothetical protein